MQKTSWEELEVERFGELTKRQMLSGENATLGRWQFAKGAVVPRHSHVAEQYTLIISGAVKFVFDDREVLVSAGGVLLIPSNVPHAAIALEDSVNVDFFAPRREDWIRGEDSYVRDKRA